MIVQRVVRSNFRRWKRFRESKREFGSNDIVQGRLFPSEEWCGTVSTSRIERFGVGGWLGRLVVVIDGPISRGQRRLMRNIPMHDQPAQIIGELVLTLDCIAVHGVSPGRGFGLRIRLRQRRGRLRIRRRVLRWANTTSVNRVPIRALLSFGAFGAYGCDWRF